ncbi:MAG: hypothetical protein ABWJ97_05400 [Thermoproteus sp.]
MKLKLKENGHEQDSIEISEYLDVQTASDWALSFLRSLGRAPREVLDMASGELLKAVLKELAKTDGDAGAVARLAVMLLEKCGK